MAKITEADLAAAGIIEDPDNPGQTLRLKDHALPHEKMSLSQLAVFIKRAGEQADRFAKGESQERFIQGHGVYLAHNHPKMKHGLWGKWCEKNKINRTKANRAERLYLKATEEWGAKTLENVCQYSLTDLYLRYGILRSPPAGDRSAATQNAKSNGRPIFSAEDKGFSGKVFDPHHPDESFEKSGDETEGSLLNRKKVVIRLVSESDRDTIQSAVADYSPVVKTATGVRLVAFVVPPNLLGKALQALFESLVKIESFALEVE